MIYHLQKKVIRICGIAVLIVFSVIFLLICGFSIKQLNETMDAMLDRISDNGGKPLEWGMKTTVWTRRWGGRGDGGGSPL